MAEANRPGTARKTPQSKNKMSNPRYPLIFLSESEKKQQFVLFKSCNIQLKIGFMHSQISHKW